MRTSSAGRLNQLPVNCPSTIIGSESCFGRWKPKRLSRMSLKYAEKPTATLMFENAYSRIRLHDRSHVLSRCAGCSEAAIRASMLLVRSRELIVSYNLQPTTHPRERQRTYRLRCPFVIFFTRFFMDPRATPEARLGLGA